jgi:Pregnancy-associated plasma protein-A
MRIKLFFLMFFLFFELRLYAQNNSYWCGNYFRENPKHNNSQYLLPRDAHMDFKVVVHIIYHDEEENISDAQVFAQIEILNLYFNDSRFITPGVAEEFKPVIKSPNFGFCLADTDPSNMPTNGIVRIKTSIHNLACLNINNRRNIFFNADGGSDVWNTSRYINIYVVNLKQCGIIGKAIFPWEATTDEDGIIIDYRTFGDIGKVNAQPSFNKGKTLVHEMGHYFGLYHLSKDVGQCLGDDLVDDTPVQSGEYFDCPEYPQFSCGVSNMFQNFMSLANDECLLFFTNGQVNRMREIIKQYRPTLETDCSKATETDSPHNIFQLDAGWLIGKKDNTCWSACLEMYDSSGKLIWSQNKNEVNYVSIPVREIELFPGVYFLKIRDNKATEVFKIYKP